MKPNLQIAPNSAQEYVEIYYDVGSGSWGIRKSQQVIKDGVYIAAEKHIDMSLNDLCRILKEAESLIPHCIRHYGKHPQPPASEAS